MPRPEIRVVRGNDLLPYIPELARLRMGVFREFPYLYEGTDANEAKYLRTYMQSPRAMAALAFVAQDLVGASTGLPMADEVPAFKQPFEDRGIHTAQLFYWGETVLLPAYRGQGLFKEFLRAREDYARSLQMKHLCFCGVLRAEDDPHRPAGYQPLDPIWNYFGYAQQPDLVAHFPWLEIGGTEPVDHRLMFWMKALV